MSIEFESLPGAVGSPPEHYGNPLREQRALADGSAVVDLSDRAVLTVTGADRLTWIDSLTSQSVAHLKPGESAETLLLDPSGRLEYSIRMLDDGTTTWLLLEAAEAAGLHPWLDRMRFMLRVEVADRTADYATLGMLGSLGSPGSLSSLGSLNSLGSLGSLGSPEDSPLEAAAPNGSPLAWHDPWNAVTPGGHQYARAARHPSSDWNYTEILVDRARLAAAARLPAAGTLALEALRIAAWRPRRATEVDERTIPHELDWLRSAVHLSKGCYRGQETIAKVHNLGHPPRRLVMLHLDGSEGLLPVHGDLVFSGSADTDREIGHITSAALHYELGPIALAVVKRSADPSSQFVVRSQGIAIAAAQEVIVPPEAGAEAHVPRLPRLGAVKR